MARPFYLLSCIIVCIVVRSGLCDPFLFFFFVSRLTCSFHQSCLHSNHNISSTKRPLASSLSLGIAPTLLQYKPPNDL